MPVDAEPKICSRCSKNIKAEGIEYCGLCLVEIMEKRVSKKLNAINCRSGKQGSYRILIACGSKTSLSCTVAAYLAKKLCMAASVSVIKPAGLSGKIQQPRNAVIMPKCADDIAAGFVEKITANSSRNIQASDASSAINIFESVTEKELELYADIKRIKYKKAKSSGLKRKLQELQARHPGTIEALAKSGRQL